MKIQYLLSQFAVFAVIFALSSCKDDDKSSATTGDSDLSEEYYTGGELGTSFDDGILAYQQPTPAVEASADMLVLFKYGEAFFENEFTSATSGVRSGLGPAYVRSACITCHPGYGHGRRMTRYNASDHGNGYLLVVFDKDTEAFVPELTGMPQTRAATPFLPPINEAGIDIEWKNYTDDWNNTFPDGETYSLIYPEINIDSAYINTNPKPTNYVVRLEATIGIYGTGLLDAIPDDSIIAEYNRQKAEGYTLNDAKYVESGFLKGLDGVKRVGRYTYGLTRGSLQFGPGSNAIWNITNVNRSNYAGNDSTVTNYRSNYITKAYATAMSQNSDIQKKLGKTASEIYDELMAKDLTPELSDEEYIQFMVWHRGLAVPAARNLDDATVQQGKKKFYAIGCTSCHKPSWKTGADDYTGDNLVKGKLPRYPYQKIWPYTDLLQHKLAMVNDIRTGWCRTMPLWGRGLSVKCTGASDHLHDMRARNYQEAIMWHGSAESDARFAVEKYRNLSKSDRDAIIKFLESI
jgi:CxxC motif-containing protein (DUF1111 family)